MVLYKIGPRIEHAMEIADRHSWVALGYEVVITSCRDGNHSPDSLHYYRVDRASHGAFDCRTWAQPDKFTHYHPDRHLFADNLREELELLYPSEFDVVLERSHLHVEHDPRGPFRKRSA